MIASILVTAKEGNKEANIVITIEKIDIDIIDPAFISLDEPDDDVNCCLRCFYQQHKGVRGMQLHEKRRQDCYRFFEVMYIILSFVSKTILVVIVMYSALQRGSD